MVLRIKRCRLYFGAGQRIVVIIIVILIIIVMMVIIIIIIVMMVIILRRMHRLISDCTKIELKKGSKGAPVTVRKHTSVHVANLCP